MFFNKNLVFLPITFLMSSAMAAPQTRLDKLLINLSEYFVVFTELIEYFAFGAGIVLIGISVLLSLKLSEKRVEFKTVAFTFASGAVLMSLGGFSDLVAWSVGFDPNKDITGVSANMFANGAGTVSPGAEKLTMAFGAVLQFLYLVGVSAIVRGLLLLRKMSGNQQITLSTVGWHIFGGTALMYIQKLGEVFYELSTLETFKV